MGFHERVEGLAKHLKSNLLFYTIAAIVIGFLVGVANKQWFAGNKNTVKEAILILAIATIYPSMVQLRMEKMRGTFTKGKEVALGLAIVFVVSPLLAISFSKMFSDIQVAMGFVTSNIVPASSASIGYVLVAEGDIELATILAILSLIGALAAIPGYLRLYASMISVSIPISKIMNIVVYTLVLPLIAGQATRCLVIKWAASQPGIRRGVIELRLKHLMQTLTMLSMLTLVALLVASKAGLLEKNPLIAVKVVGLQALMLALLLGLVEVVDRAMKVSYRAHSAVAFISATKNQSIAAAIAVMALGPRAAIVPALVPVIQAPVAIAYLHRLIRRCQRGDKETSIEGLKGKTGDFRKEGVRLLSVQRSLCILKS